MNKKLLKQIKSLPPKPGVYLFFAKGESASGRKDASRRILYIGKAINLKNRVKAHLKNNDSLIGQFRQKITAIDYIETENETQALILEDQLIKKYKPKYNIQWQDDKSYFWVSFSNDEWPRVKIIHQPKSINPPQPSPVSSTGQALKGGSKKLSPPLGGVRGDFTTIPIGPFTNGTELKQILRALRKILPYRTCKNAYNKPCLQWHLGLCPAHRNPPPPSLKGGSKNASPPLGGVRGDFEQQQNTYLNSLNTLRQLLRLYANEPIRVEAYDISNIQGTNATGSMIVFEGVKPKKSDYRRFRIKTVRGANDVAMLKEVLRRRLNHSEWPSPDLILIDGGRAQLNIANLSQDAYHLSLPLISLAKRVDELYTIYNNKTLRLNALPINLRLTIQAIRNEAHRFAISYYRKLHRRTIKK